LEEKMTQLLRYALLACVFVASAALAQTNRIVISTGGTGGVYYPLGGGLANILSKNVPGLQATAEVTGGSIDNLKLLGAGKSEVVFTMADSGWDALQGLDKFKDNKVSARTLVVLYPNRLHVVTIDGTGINKLADLKGKRVSTGSPGSGTEITAFRLLDAVGIDKDKDIKKERLSVAESVNALKDRKIDALIWVGGVPTGALTDLAATPGVKIKLIDHGDAADAMNKKYGPLYVKGTIPAKAYSGQDTATTNVDVWNLLVTSDKMSDKMAYDIVKTIFDKKADLVAVHQDAGAIALENQATSSPLPFHPGAKKYFEERGVKVQ
jgi:TRAP transporter TAXI family solute receptor